jgi:hypothetical protein
MGAICDFTLFLFSLMSLLASEALEKKAIMISAVKACFIGGLIVGLLTEELQIGPFHAS